jgi:hypothetical protein
MAVSPKVTIILAWVAKNAPAILSAIRQVPDFAIAAVGLVQAHMDGRVSVREIRPVGDSKILEDISRPDILVASEHASSRLDALQADLNEQRRSLSKANEDNELQHNRMLLEIEIVELIISAQTFQRFANNLNIHASNLKIHFQSLKNQAEMFDVIRRQNEALAQLKAAVDHLATTNANAPNRKDAERGQVLQSCIYPGRPKCYIARLDPEKASFGFFDSGGTPPWTVTTGPKWKEKWRYTMAGERRTEGARYDRLALQCLRLTGKLQASACCHTANARVRARHSVSGPPSSSTGPPADYLKTERSESCASRSASWKMPGWHVSVFPHLPSPD